MSKGNRENHPLIQSCDWHRYNKYINPNKSKIHCHAPKVIVLCCKYLFEHAGGLQNPQHLLKVLWGTKRAPHSPPQPINSCCLECTAQGCTKKFYSNLKAFHGYSQGAGVIPTMFIFLGSGTGVSGRVCVMSLDSSDACLWTVSLDCTFGERSME